MWYKLTIGINLGFFVRKNHPLRRWKSNQDKALLYLEGQDLIMVFRPNFENLSGFCSPTSYTERHFKQRFDNIDDAKAFAKKMQSPFETHVEQQGFVGELEINYN